MLSVSTVLVGMLSCSATCRFSSREFWNLFRFSWPSWYEGFSSSWLPACLWVSSVICDTSVTFSVVCADRCVSVCVFITGMESSSCCGCFISRSSGSTFCSNGRILSLTGSVIAVCPCSALICSRAAISSSSLSPVCARISSIVVSTVWVRSWSCWYIWESAAISINESAPCTVATTCARLLSCNRSMGCKPSCSRTAISSSCEISSSSLISSKSSSVAWFTASFTSSSTVVSSWIGFCSGFSCTVLLSATGFWSISVFFGLDVSAFTSCFTSKVLSFLVLPAAWSMIFPKSWPFCMFWLLTVLTAAGIILASKPALFTDALVICVLLSE